MQSNHEYRKIAPFILFILLLIVFYQLVKPIITIFLTSIILAYITFPLYKKICTRIKYNALSIILSLSIVIIVILIPFTLLAIGLTKQGYEFYNSLSTKVEKGEILGFSCTSNESKICLILNQAELFSKTELSKVGFDKKIQNIIPKIENNIATIILKIPLLITKIFICIIISFFLIKDHKTIQEKATSLLPMRKKTIAKLIDEFKKITHTVIYAQLIVALVQGTLATIAFYIFGVPFPLILGLALSFCALIPTIGTALIWIPASLYLILMGYFTKEYGVLAKGIGLFLYGLIIISTIDNILLAKLIQKKTNILQLTTMIGVIGGTALFGIIGIFIGPILLPLLITYFETFKERFD